jgi:hypothetical protein
MTVHERRRHLRMWAVLAPLIALVLLAALAGGRP